MNVRHGLRGVRPILVAGALVLATCAAVFLIEVHERTDPTTRQVERASSAAIQASMAMTVPPRASQTAAPTAAAVARQQAAGQASIARYFSGAAAQLVSKDLTTAIGNEVGGTPLDSAHNLPITSRLKQPRKAGSAIRQAAVRS